MTELGLWCMPHPQGHIREETSLTVFYIMQKERGRLRADFAESFHLRTPA
jgi:hypothetical protein